MKGVIAFPAEIVKTEYWTHNEIVFLDETGWWLYDNSDGCRKYYEIGFSKFNTSDAIDPVYIRDTLNWWMPVWTRWMANSFQYEHNRIKSLIIIDKIVNDILFLKAHFAIINTSVPHHVDTSLLQISLAKANVKQIFLYANVFDGRLLPMVQNQSIFDRKAVSVETSVHEYTNILKEFIENRLKGNAPIVNTKITSIKKNIYLAVFTLGIMRVRDLVYYLYNIHRSQKPKWATFFNTISYRESFSLMLQQRKFLKSYDKKKLSNNESNTFFNEGGVKVVIAAHYQPEATSFPEGGDFSNHLEIVMKLRALGFTGVIGYKEHPASWMYIDNIIGSTRVGIYRSKDYLSQLQSYNCVFIDEKFSLPIDRLFANKYIPVTISGSIAIERSLLGLHTIVAGEPWFKGLPGTISLKDIASLKVIPIEWLTYSSVVETESRLFLLNILNKSTLTNVIGVGTGIPNSANNMVTQFKEELKKLLKGLSINI